MASISVPCAKTLPVAGGSGSNVQSSLEKRRISFPLAASSPNASLSFGSTLVGFQGSNRKRSAIIKVQSELNEVASEISSNSVLGTNSKFESTPEKDESAESDVSDISSSISAFMSEVSELVKLVDSRDVAELQLKQLDFELLIRKKEALPQPAPAPAPVIHMQAPYQQTAFPPAPSPPPSPASSPAPLALPSPSPLPAPENTKSSSHPVMNCPMAGTFYRSPAPGAPPFVKVGDQVKKGQVLCIVEAMKLMNEIEADRSGTVAEILVEDGKPVSVGLPLFVIAP